MNKKLLASPFLVALWCLLMFRICYAQNTGKHPVDYVNNKIGAVDIISDCVIGPQLPLGSINPSPQTKNGEDDGYNPKEPIRGFGQLHVSGTGWGTNGQIFLSPQIGLAVREAEHDSPKSDETAKPYEYGVTLSRYGITTKVCPSYHSAIYQFTFPKSDSTSLLLDLTHNIPMDIKPRIGGAVSKGEIHFDNAAHTLISGYGIYRGGFGGGDYTIYFSAEISKQPHVYGTWLNGKVAPLSTSQGLLARNDRVGAYFGLSTAENEIVYFKVAVSYKSIEQAHAWLTQEIPGWDYQKTKDAARDTWNRQLNKIKLTGGTEKAKMIFYTALYHAELMPRNRTNDTRAFGKNVAMWDDHFAIWDTWRTLYPLHALIDPDVVTGTVNSFIARFKKNGVVRDAFVNGNDMNNEQGGNNIDNVIADAYAKNVKGINWEEAYQVLKYDADHQRLGSFAWRKEDSLNNTYKTTGWIPAGIMSCSMSLEYSYNDYCTALVAKGLGKTADYQKYFERSKQWVNLWNKDAEDDGFKGFIEPKTLKGDFVNIDKKTYPGSWRNYFYEGSSWNYSWFMPHQFNELVMLNGGKEAFAKKLNYGFEHKLIKYDNEPAFLAVHGFLYAGRPDLTSYWIHQLMSKSYTDEGYPGNEDSGAMSSWYIFSAIGLFPNAGQDIYYLTGSSFKKVVMRMGNGKLLTISAPNSSPENIYVQSIRVNGKPWAGEIINHRTISSGCNIEFEMGNKPKPVKQL